jgi:hypothetical protein
VSAAAGMSGNKASQKAPSLGSWAARDIILQFMMAPVFFGYRRSRALNGRSPYITRGAAREGV